MHKLQHFKLLKEDAATYSVAHPNGKKLIINKKGLSDKAHQMIKSLRKQQFADGGVVDLSDKDKAAMAKYIDTNPIHEMIRQPNDMQNMLFGTSNFRDTGRKSSGPGEAIDSVIGAPARVGVNELQNGNLNLETLKKMYNQIGADPRTAPTGYDIASKVTDNPYLGTALATAVDFGAQLPVGELAAAGKLPGIVGEIKGVKNAGKIADATEAFAERAKAPVSTETKIAQMHGETGDVRDAVPTLLDRAHDDKNNFGGNTKVPSAYDNPKNAPPKVEEPFIKKEKLPEDYAREEWQKPDQGPTAEEKWNQRTEHRYVSEPEGNQTEFWHDPNDHSFTDEAKKSLDALYARGVPEQSLYKIHEETTPDSPYGRSDYKELPVLPNFSATPQGVIGRPGIAEPFHGNNQEAFPWMDSKFGSAKQLLQRHNSMGMPAEIHTSSDLIGREDYLKEIPQGSTVNLYKMTPDDSLNRIYFPGNPSNKRLDAAAESLKAAGIETNVINPTGRDVWNALPEGRRKLAKDQFGTRDSFINHIDNMPGIRGVVPKPDKYAHGGKVMNLNNFKLLKEDADSYSLTHPNGKQMSIPKAGLTANAHKLIKSLRGAQHFDGGGQIPGQEGSIAQIDPSDIPYAIGRTLTNTIFPVDSPAPASEQAPQPNVPTSIPDPAQRVPAQQNGQVTQDDPAGMNNINMQRAYEREKAANTNIANVVSGEGDAESNYIKDTQAKIDQLPTQQDIINANKQKSDTLMQAYQDKNIDPDHYWHGKSTGSKIAAGIGLFLGGLSQGYIGGSNPAMDVIQTAIGRDIDAQKNDQNKAHTLWSMNRDALGSDLAANLSTQNQMYTGLKYKLQQAASQFKGPMAMANAQMANAQIDQKIAQNNFRLGLMNPSKDNPDPASRVQFLVPPERQQKVFDEIDAAQNTAANAPKILQAFDNAAIKIHAVDFIPGMENADQKAMHALMGPTFKDVEGTVRQAAMDNMNHNTTPQFGDDKNTIQTKRNALIGYLKSKSAAPTAKGFGIDLQQYPSTHFNGAPAKNQVEIRYDKQGNAWKQGPNGKPVRVK